MNTAVGHCDSGCCRRGVDYWGDSCCCFEDVVEELSIVLLRSISRWKMVFNSACEAFEAFSHVRTTVRARNTAVSIFVIFTSPKECFAVAELNIGVGIELEPSAEKARFCALDQFAECGTFSDEFVIVRISGEIAFKLISESTNLIIGEFFRLLARESFEVVFYQ